MTNIKDLPKHYQEDIAYIKKNKPISEDENKNKVFNLAQMEELVKHDEFLSNEYQKRAAGYEDKEGDFISPDDIYGYHWNEVILIILFNKYVLNNQKKFNKYKSMKNRAKPRKKRGELKLDEEIYKGSMSDEEMAAREKQLTPQALSGLLGKPLPHIKTNTIEIKGHEILYKNDLIGLVRQQDNKIIFNIITKYDEGTLKSSGIYQDLADMIEENPDTFNMVYLRFLKSNKQVPMLAEEDQIDETTTSASSGQYNSPFAFSKDGDLTKGAKKQKTIKRPIGTAFSMEINEWMNPENYINLYNTLNEEKKTKSTSYAEKIGKENKKNYKKDLDISKLDNTKPESGAFIEPFTYQKDKDSLKKDETKKNRLTSKEKDFIKMNSGKGLEDIEYGRKPTKEFEDRMKKDMGDEMYQKRQDKIKYDKPFKNVMYKTQPQITKDNYENQNLKENVIMGKYKNIKNNTEFIKFNPSQIENILKEDTKKMKEVFVEGIGNQLSEKIGEFRYFINEETNKVFKIAKSEITKGLEKDIDLSKIKHLMEFKNVKTKDKYNLNEEEEKLKNFFNIKNKK